MKFFIGLRRRPWKTSGPVASAAAALRVANASVRVGEFGARGVPFVSYHACVHAARRVGEAEGDSSV